MINERKNWAKNSVPKNGSKRVHSTQQIHTVVFDRNFSPIVVGSSFQFIWFYCFYLLSFSLSLFVFRVIQQSHPVCNTIMLFGVIICLLSVILLGIDGRFVDPETYPGVSKQTCSGAIGSLCSGSFSGYATSRFVTSHANRVKSEELTVRQV